MKIHSLLLSACLAVGHVHAQGTAFTYQGSLTENGTPANGTNDLTFTLYDNAAAGATVGASNVVQDLVFSNGLFTVMLDFGAGAFPGAGRWLEIAVRPGASTGDYSPLSPRQPITSSPYAIQSLQVAAGGITTAALADGVVTSAKIAPGAVSQLGASDGSPSNAVQVNASGLVGVGTNSPLAGLHVTSGHTNPTVVLLSTVNNGVGSSTNLGGNLRVAASGNLLAVTATGDDAFTVFDITNPSSPVQRSTVKDGSGTFTNLTGIGGAALSGNLLAVAAGYTTGTFPSYVYYGAVTLVDVSNPDAPARSFTLRDGVGGFNDLALASDVALSGNVLAVAASGDAAVTLVNVSSPAVPSLLTVLKQGVGGFTNLTGVRSVALSGNLLALAASSNFPLFNHAVTLVDISNPASPILRSVLKDGVNGFNELFGANRVAINGNLLAISADLDDAVTLVDVSNPALPVLRAVLKDGVGGFNALTHPQGVAFYGNLLAIASDTEDAVTLVDVSTPASPILHSVLQNSRLGADAPSSLAMTGSRLIVGGNSILALLDLALPAKVGILSDGWMGIGTVSPLAPLHSVGNLLVEDATWVTMDTLHFGAGTDVNASGFAATALGYQSEASGNYATALGASTASGDYSTAAGNSVASGGNATAMGLSTAGGGFATALGLSTAYGNFSTALGNSTATGYSSASIGRNATAAADYTLAFGRLASAVEENATALGVGTTARAPGSTALGYYTTAGTNEITTLPIPPFTVFTNLYGSYATALGYQSFARNDYSTAMGSETIARGDYATAMGQYSDASGDRATAMGDSTASGSYSLSAGFHPVASGDYAVALGHQCTASGVASCAVGESVASGDFSTALGNGTAAGYGSVALGIAATADANYAVAVGRRAKANHQGALVLADSSNSDVASVGNNSVTMRAAGGYRLFSNASQSSGVSLAASGTSWSTISDRNAKKDFTPVDGREVLEKLAAVPVTRWHYNWEPGEATPHIGPVAQDFKAAFYPGSDDKTITTLEFDGVALAAIQGLNQKVEEQRAKLKSRDADVEKLKQTVAALKALVEQLAGQARE